ncbi:hypothetical protein BGZ63DRAFT_426648 [Mariannaea sp. PMI_226]|nr:hypothetical protein BGZ63DRAFT_426648 [Mariannaea sp. PMI_226]
MSSLEHRTVVSSFIFKFPEDDLTKKPQVALFRRSDKVNTYQHKLAPIAGSVEKTDSSPLAAAWREIEEETTLTSSSLRLFRQGKPYSFIDESIGREWTINPFAFVLRSAKEGNPGKSGIHIDWEHEGYEWFDPDAVNDSDDFGGVPRLLESLRRVWFNIDLGDDAGNILRDGLVTLQMDHESGARQLASKALEIFIEVVKKLEVGSPETWWRNVRFAGWHLWKNGRESMGASILNVVLSSLAIIESKLPPDGQLQRDSIRSIIDALQQYAQQRHRDRSRVAESCKGFFESHYSGLETLRILMLSCSSTISYSLESVLKSTKAHLDVRILESRPLFEGVKTADALASFAKTHNIPANITVFTDASVGEAARGVDLVLLGADLIDRQGNVSNKTGSLPAVLVAKHVSPQVKTVILSEREKVLPFEPPQPEENDADEIAQSWGQLRLMEGRPGQSAAQFAVRNVYFEWVPAELIDIHVTEGGTMKTEEIAEWADEVRERADRFFTVL